MIKKGRATKYLIIEAVLAVCLFGASMGVGIFNIPIGNYDSDFFYDAAIVVGKKDVPYIAGAGINQVYLYMLRALFLVFGNIWQVGIVAQVVLLILGAMVFYLAVRKVSGTTSSLLAIGTMLGLSCFLPITYSYGPQMLYFLLFSIGLYCIHKLIKDSVSREKFGMLFFLQAAFVGLYAGFLIYLDLFSLILLLPVLILSYVMWRNVRRKWAVLLGLWMLFAIIGLLLAISLEALSAGLTIGGIFASWLNFSCRELFDGSVLNGNSSFETLLCDRHIWLGIFLVATYVVAFVYCFVYRNSKKAVCQGNEVETALDNPNDDKSGLVKEVIEDIKTSIAGNEELSEVVVDKEETTSVVRFIENPLPLPKKHVKKTLDYAFQPDFDAMDYDVKVSDADDYDLK